MRKTQDWSLAQGDYPRLTRAVPMGQFQKKSKQVSEGGEGIDLRKNKVQAKDIKEGTCGNSRGQLKRK